MISRSIVLISFFQLVVSYAQGADWVIPFKLKGGAIVVRGAIGATGGLRFKIDTGATTSLLDSTTIKRLGLKPDLQERRLIDLDRVTRAKRVLVTDLRLGGISAALYCLEADLSNWSVDGVIGLDFLRNEVPLKNTSTSEVLKENKLTIDFKSSTIQFGTSEWLRYSVPIENERNQLVVAAKVFGAPLRVAVDTGANVTTLFRQPDSNWINLLPFTGSTRLPTLTGDSIAGKIEIPNIELGNCSWGWTSALVIDTQIQGIDGLLSVYALRMRILHFDFDRNLMSWDR